MRKRIIKFRGKKVRGGDWVYGDLIHLTAPNGIEGCVIITNDKVEDVFPDNKLSKAVLEYTDEEVAVVFDNTVCQFTGYHDLNDKRIYEGDIVKFTAHDALGNELGNQQGVVKFKFGSYLIGGYDMYDILLNDDEAEIVGNIYDNPELLNRKDE